MHRMYALSAARFSYWVSKRVHISQRNRIKHENTFHNSKLINLKMNLVKKLLERWEIDDTLSQ